MSEFQQAQCIVGKESVGVSAALLQRVRPEIDHIGTEKY